ncbi:Nudix hydrolase [Arachis hypogaea]|nr:Nudix hydrolase [Arachis hypogaea]
MEREDEDATQERRLFRRALSSLLRSIEAAAAARACRAPGVDLCASHRYLCAQSSIRRELEELGVTLPKDAFELIFVFLQECFSGYSSNNVYVAFMTVSTKC